ncbi:hypothetical protein C6Y40_03850 [Alteromonas alba]|uniref:Uncharacterized protein n=1 Tax=Alteromonas alba TaxID=2079529 RepID=A0A2S9VEP8_9ALTE|nr:hypothetical protein [Alteromonas alba]PRO74937.1 hypothetical protein C6Y40_03850 [Alteromonas alba]
MAMRWREKLILAGVESTYGAGPAAALDASNYIRLTEPSIAFESENITDESVRFGEGAYEDIPFGEHITLTFRVHLFGSGTEGVAPPYSALLRASRMTETVDAGVSVAYTLASDFGSSLAMEFRIGNNLHAINGARGAFTIIFEKGIPMLEFTFKGLWAVPTHTIDSLPAVNNAPWLGFVPTGPGRTSAVTLYGETVRPYSLNLNPGNEAVYDQSLVDETIIYSDRDGSGQIQIEAPTLDTINFFARHSNRQHGPLAITHGATAGNICTISCPRVQVQKPSYTNLDNNNVGYDIDLKLLPDAGNDEISLLFT